MFRSAFIDSTLVYMWHTDDFSNILWIIKYAAPIHLKHVMFEDFSVPSLSAHQIAYFTEWILIWDVCLKLNESEIASKKGSMGRNMFKFLIK